MNEIYWCSRERRVDGETVRNPVIGAGHINTTGVPTPHVVMSFAAIPGAVEKLRVSPASDTRRLQVAGIYSGHIVESRNAIDDGVNSFKFLGIIKG